jgi:hypothetical protein
VQRLQIKLIGCLGGNEFIIGRCAASPIALPSRK